jgi:hypothetical protein
MTTPAQIIYGPDGAPVLGRALSCPFCKSRMWVKEELVRLRAAAIDDKAQMGAVSAQRMRARFVCADKKCGRGIMDVVAEQRIERGGAPDASH